MNDKTKQQDEDQAQAGTPADGDTDAAMMAAIAAAADAEIEGTAAAMMPGQPEPAQVVDQAEQIGALLTMGVMVAAPALPFLPECYTPPVVNAIAQAAAAVCDKYGWQVGDVMSPELALAIAVLPPSVQAFVMWKDHKAEQERKRQRDEASGAHGVAQALPMEAAPVSILAGQRVQPGA